LHVGGLSSAHLASLRLTLLLPSTPRSNARVPGAGPIPAAGPATARNHPVIPPGDWTPAITRLEQESPATRKQVVVLEQELKALDPKTDLVAIAKVKRQETPAEHKIQHYNFAVTQELKKPLPAPQPAK